MGKRKEFWFFKPVEDSADGWGNRKKNTARDPNTCRSFVHSKTTLYAYNQTSLQLRPANFLYDFDARIRKFSIFAHHYLQAEALSGVAPHCLTVREKRRGAMGEDRRAVNACIQSGGQGR